MNDVSVSLSPAAKKRAFNAFVRSHLPVLLRYAQRRLRYYQALAVTHADEYAPEDLVHETVVAALRRLEEKPPDQGFYPWFRRIADTTLRRHTQRAAARRQTVSLERTVGVTENGEVILLREVLVDTTEQSVHDAVEQRHLQSLLERALNRLPEDWRECFLMTALDGLGLAEIAEIEGQEIETVRNQVHRARDFLREVLQRRILDWEDDAQLEAALDARMRPWAA